MAKREDNLKPIQKGQLSKDEAKKRGSKGGIKSGESRRQKRQLKEELELLLENGKTQEKVCTALIDKALSGDIRAFEVLRDSIGQKPKDEVIQHNRNILVASEEDKKLLDEI